MANRREFIQSGIALTAATLSAGEAARAAANDPRRLKLERFVFDNRFTEAISAGRVAAAAGIPLAETSGDVTDIWFHDFDLRWKKAPMALAGITTRHGLFVLETLAADHRMRVVYRGEHGTVVNGSVSHELSGPAEVVARVTVSDGEIDTAWPTSVTLAMLSCPLGRPATARVELECAANRAIERDDALISWIIAPRMQVSSIA